MLQKVSPAGPTTDRAAGTNRSGCYQIPGIGACLWELGLLKRCFQWEQNIECLLLPGAGIGPKINVEQDLPLKLLIIHKKDRSQYKSI